MKPLKWKINRLRAMEGKEIGYRLSQRVAQSIEKRRIQNGWSPQPSQPVFPRTTLFCADCRWQPLWQQRYGLDEEALCELEAGRIDFFGHPFLDVGWPVDWHRDPLTGIKTDRIYGKAIDYRDSTRVGNVKFLWELGRHQHLVPLAVAYAVTGQTRYRDTVLAQIEGWIGSSPFGVGIHWCSALEVALRLISWALVHSLIALRDGPEGLMAAYPHKRQLGVSIYQQAWFIRHFLSRYSSANNHLIGELTGLWVTTQVFDLGKPGRVWALEAKDELEVEAGKQVFSDGVDREQATYYHLWVLEYLLFASLVGQRSSVAFSKSFLSRTRAMAEFLRDVSPPDGEPPQIGDSDEGFVARFEARWPQNPYADVLAAESLCRGGPQPPFLPQKAFWYGMMAGMEIPDGAQSCQISSPSPYPRVYPEGGYVVLGDGEMHLVFDAGSLGYPSIAAHGHADALSFWLAIQKEWWLVDSGTYAYHGDLEWREYFRSSAAHNTLVVDGLSQSRIGGSFLWLEHAQGYLDGYGSESDGSQWVRGHHDGYRKQGIFHHRSIRVDPGNREIEIQDLLMGKGSHELRLHFHFSPDVQLGVDPATGVWVATKTHRSVRMEIFLEPGWSWEVKRGSMEPILGWYSRTLEVKEPAPTLVGRWVGQAPKGALTRMRVVRY